MTTNPDPISKEQAVNDEGMTPADWRHVTESVSAAARRLNAIQPEGSSEVVCRRRVIVGPLANTIEKQGQGVTSIGADGKPECSRHGAMNRVSAERDWWRCLSCNIGVECALIPIQPEPPISDPAPSERSLTADGGGSVDSHGAALAGSTPASRISDPVHRRRIHARAGEHDSRAGGCSCSSRGTAAVAVCTQARTDVIGCGGG